ncbi:hypothetical protein ACFX15_013447 [Malus domestica]
MDTYVRIGDLVKSVKVYRRKLKEGISPNSVSYTILINGMCQDGKVAEACGIFGQILKCGSVPSIETIEGRLRDAVKVYIQMGVYNMKPDLVTYTVLIKGKMEDAMLMINTMLEKGPEPNVVAYSCLIDGYFKSENTKGALELLEEMLKSVSPNIVSYSILIDGLCKRGLGWRKHPLHFIVL